MSDKDVEAVRREVEALRAEQEAPDSPEALATLPTLTVADIEPARLDPEVADVKAPLPCLAHELDTRHIDYVYHYFDLRRVGFAELPYVGVLTDLLGKLDTKLHTASTSTRWSRQTLATSALATRPTAATTISRLPAPCSW